MKIKTVCEQTGLTDRAIRFYIEEGLLEPAYSENYLGRKSLEFRDEDVKRLSDIAVLRKFGFSVAQIKAITHSPEESRFVMESMRQQKQDIIDGEQETLTVLNRLGDRQSYTLPELAAALKEEAARQPMPREAAPKTGKFAMYLQALLMFFGCGLLGVIIIGGLCILTDMWMAYESTIGFEWSAEWFIGMIGRVSREVFPVLFFGSVLVSVFYSGMILWKYGRNDGKPEITVHAIVVDKRVNADSVVLGSFYSRDGGMITTLVFRTDDGQHLLLTVPRDTYYNMNIGTRGKLTYQGTKMVKFTPTKRKA